MDARLIPKAFGTGMTEKNGGTSAVNPMEIVLRYIVDYLLPVKDRIVNLMAEKMAHHSG
jgi:hypothetical protein